MSSPDQVLRQVSEVVRLFSEKTTELAVIRLGLDGRVTGWNAVSVRTKGYRREEILGCHISLLFTAEDVRSGQPEEVLRVARREGRWSGEWWCLCKGGRRMWTRGTLMSLRDGSGRLQGYLMVTREVTGRTERAHYYWRFFEEVPVGIVVTTPEGNIADINPAGQKILSYSREELRGMHVADLYADSSEWKQIVRRVALEGAIRERDVRLRGKDDAEVLVRLTAMAWHGLESTSTYQGFFFDITEHRQLRRDLLQVQEEERLRFGQDLHDGIASRLTGISIMLGVLARRIERVAEDGEQNTAVGEIVDRVQNIQALVDESCDDVRRLSHNLAPVELSEKNFAAALERLSENVEGGIFETNIADSPALDDETATHLYWIAQEAVVNVQKYAKADQVVIRLEYRAGHLVLEIQDDGQGFDAARVEWEGLGLRTIRHRTKLLGAALTVESTPGEGTLLRCRMPA